MFKQGKYISFESICMETMLLFSYFLTFTSDVSPIYFSVKYRICLNEPQKTHERFGGLREPNL